MATVVPVLVNKIPWGNAAASGLIGEVWRIPASTAADTATITSIYLSKVLYVIGDVQHTALTDNTAAIITLDTIAASNFVDIVLIGPAKTGPSLS